MIYNRDFTRFLIQFTGHAFVRVKKQSTGTPGIANQGRKKIRKRIAGERRGLRNAI